MSHNYDNWEKLVAAVLRREELRAIALRNSTDTSSISDGEESSSYHTTISSSSSSIRDFDKLLFVHTPRIQLPVDYSDLMTNHTDWKSMLPPGQNEIVWNSASLSFSLEKRSGKNCFMVGAKGLIGNSTCVPYSKSRFSEVALLEDISHLSNIRGLIETQRLSPDTIYGAYLVLKLAKLSHDFDVLDESNIDALVYENAFESANAIIRLVVDDEELYRIEPLKTRRKFKTVSRVDGWKEIEMGEFSIDDENQSGKVEAQFERDGLPEPHSSKIHLFVEGIEFRPMVYSTDFSGPKNKISRLFGNFIWKT